MSASPVLLTRDPLILDHVLAVAAVARVEPEVLADAAALRASWVDAQMVVVGVDQAARVAALALPRRREIYVVGTDESSTDELSRWSVQLGAAVLVLPSGATWLASAMADQSTADRSALTIAVIGGSGGVGVSTLAAALAYEAGRQGRRSLLVDLDPIGGGIDLLVGAEREPGWRWPDLAGARGQLGDLSGQLPSVDGVDVLSMAREPRGGAAARRRAEGGASPSDDFGGWPEETAAGPWDDLASLSGEPLAAVLRSSLRSYDLVVADLPRAASRTSTELIQRADLVLLVAFAGVRGIAAARRVAAEIGGGQRVALVVRESRAARMDASTVGRGLSLPVLGVLADEPALATAAEKGEPPGRSARSSVARACREIIAELDASGSAA